MPIGESFWNPYRMIPVRPTVPARRPPLTHESEKGLQGTFFCSLEALTPLFIGSGQHQGAGQTRGFIKRSGRPVIPGTSLKGMIRSLVEIVGNGCAAIGKHSDASHVSCSNHESLCVACRMFGMLAKGSVHAGFVTAGDGLCDGTAMPRTVIRELLMGTPEPDDHKPFYVNPSTGEVDRACRKMFHHMPKYRDRGPAVPSNLASRAWKVDAVQPGTRFGFEVTFRNLMADELDLLVYCLALEGSIRVEIPGHEGSTISLQGPMRHKLGHGKPLGLGSVAIGLDRVCLVSDPAARWTKLAARDEKTGPGLGAWIWERTAAMRSDSSPTMKHLRHMMVWDPEDRRDFHYPTYEWFQRAGATRLKPIV